MTAIQVIVACRQFIGVMRIECRKGQLKFEQKMEAEEIVIGKRGPLN